MPEQKTNESASMKLGIALASGFLFFSISTGIAASGPAAPRPAKLDYKEVTSLVDASNKSGLSTRAVVSLIWKESGFDPDAKAGTSTATGLMQMTKGAVEEVNRVDKTKYKHSEMTDATKNIECGTRYLAILIKRHGSDKSGLEHFGTGKGYADNILACEKCLATDAGKKDPQPCLDAIHP